jgi:hypothetical protein
MKKSLLDGHVRVPICRSLAGRYLSLELTFTGSNTIRFSMPKERAMPRRDCCLVNDLSVGQAFMRSNTIRFSVLKQWLRQ